MNVAVFSHYVNTIKEMNDVCPCWTNYPKAWISDFLMDDGSSYEQVLSIMGKDAFDLLQIEFRDNDYYIDDIVSDLYYKYRKYRFSMDAYMLVVAVFASVLNFTTDIAVANIGDYMFDSDIQKLNDLAEQNRKDRTKYTTALTYYNNALNLEKDKKWDKVEAEYGNAISLFDTILSYKDSKSYLNKCKIAKQSAHNNHIYYCAKDALAKATTIDEYKVAGGLFLTLSGFSDAKEKYEFCINRIKEITIEQQYQTILSQKDNAIREKDLQKRSILLQDIIKTFEQYALSEKASVAVTEAKKLLSDCLAEIENQRIQSRFEEAKKFFEKDDLITDYKERINAFSQIISDFEADAKTEDFSKLISDCREKINEANLNINYNFAEMLMTSAETEADFNSAATVFGKISDFKDSLEKKQVCIENAKKCAIEETYNLAMEKIEQSKKISFFNWKKYR